MTDEGRLEPPSLAAIRAALAASGGTAKRSYGQHFLHDPGLLSRIVDAATLEPGDVVLEIGPGPGVLTATLLARGVQVVAVEADPTMIDVLQRLLGPHDDLDVLECDALKERPAPGPSIRAAIAAKRPPRTYSLVANLPYQIASPLLVDVFESEPPRVAVVMIQREVSQRLKAAPDTDAYGLLSVMIQLRATVEEIARVKPGAFWPPPKVDSSVVRLLPRASDDLSLRIGMLPPTRLHSTLRRAFGERRKTLENNLLRDSPCDREALAAALEGGGFRRGRRAETLAPEEFVTLAEVLVACELGGDDARMKRRHED